MSLLRLLCNYLVVIWGQLRYLVFCIAHELRELFKR
jgi:hypothetical protein